MLDVADCGFQLALDGCGLNNTLVLGNGGLLVIAQLNINVDVGCVDVGDLLLGDDIFQLCLLSSQLNLQSIQLDQQSVLLCNQLQNGCVDCGQCFGGVVFVTGFQSCQQLVDGSLNVSNIAGIDPLLPNLCSNFGTVFLNQVVQFVQNDFNVLNIFS